MVFNEEVVRFPVFLILATSLAAQRGGPVRGVARGETPRGTTQTSPTVPRVLQVDAVVTDSDGRFVPHLPASDFTLSVDGKPQPVSDFNEHAEQKARVVLLVDDAGLSPSGTAKLRTALKAFLDQLQPGDQAAVLRTRSSVTAWEGLTSDRQTLTAAIDRIEYFPPPQNPKVRDEFLLAGLASGLRRTLMGLRSVPGRKAVVFFSEQLATARQHADRFKGFSALAADASAVCYALDLADTSGGLELDSLMLAGDSGGLNVGPDVATALKRVLADQRNYYLLSYHAEGAEVFPGAGISDHTQVQVRNASLLVRARTVPMQDRTAGDFPSRTADASADAVSGAQFAPDAIHVRLTPAFNDLRDLGLTVHIQCWVDAHDLTFTHQLNGFHDAAAELELSIFNSTGGRVQQSAYDLTLNLTNADYPKALASGWVGQANLRVPSSGVYLVRAGARDAASSRAGSAGELVVVPDVSGGDLQLSSISLRPDEAATLNEAIVERLFKPGGNLRFGYQVLNASVDKGMSVELETRVRMFRGETELFSGSPQVLPTIKLDDPKRRSISGQLRLGPSLGAGHYRLEVMVAEPHSPKPREAHQWVDFEVRP